jgi:hypothetical protein
VARLLGDALITLALSHEKRARIWFDRPEEYVAQPSSMRTIRVLPKARLEVQRKTVVVEMFVPGGGRFGYGLLGATIVDDGQIGDRIAVEIPVTGSSGPVFRGSLAGKLDVVRWGLPVEYAEAVAVGAQEFLLACGAPTLGAIQFAWAAHAFVGSSSHWFRRLAALVTRLLITPDEASLKDLLDRM